MQDSARDEGEVGSSAPFDPAELRAAPRHALLIRSAKLIIEEAEYLCVLRDASDTGVSLRLFHEVPASRFMVLELQNEERHAIELVWRDGERMGLRFCEPIAVHRLIEMRTPFEKRQIRVRLNVPAVIGVGLDTAMCTILDLSQHGAKVACDRTFALDQRVGLVASGMPRVPAKIRWRKESHAGLSFETTFQLAELANIVAGFHSATLRVAQARPQASTG